MLRRTVLLVALAAFSASRPPDIPFEKVTLDLGANETCAFADMNGDGKLDIISGENWYAAPGWKKQTFRELAYSNYYIDAFSDLPMDVDGDGFADIATVSWFSRAIHLWKNPGRTRRAWKPLTVEEGFNVEFAFLVDIDNDGKAQEILPQFGNKNAPLAWYDLKDMSGGTPKKHVVAPQSYGHGIGAGDVSGDGKTDILTPLGWFERTADGWKWHGDWETEKPKALGFQHVIDIDGDGKNDILTSNAHDYGIYWLKNLGDGKWQENMIDNSWSQAHATTLADLNGDGQLDLVTGKRFMAHNGRDPGEREPLGVYWYEYRRVNGRIEWARHIVDYSTRTGGGMQIPVADLDGDGDMDFATGGKSGLFLFINKTK